MTDPDTRPATLPNSTPPPSGTPLPYGTPDVPRLAVRGEAHIEADPEIARIDITVQARGTDRTATLKDLTHRNDQALALVKSYGDAVEKVDTGAFSVTPEVTAKGRHERVRAYHGRVRITATLTDFTALGELTTRLADLDLTRVDGPWWALRPDSPAHREARRQAVQDAVQRAREYAEALGARLDAVLEIADTGAENATPMPVPGAAFRSVAYGGAAESAPAPALDLEPARQEVYAQVNARFTMTRPQL
ncbi:SIMPL domain-containing protein [Streptomyces albofaciens JCM 4342]|uniref:SIMPL domain-containing protein n=1 Tax=Streptomyces albofaciens TaxID=66866 RepID=UPI00123C06A5|nr:SIMPL domain-containing protein [Streptomyces albofaciens]KAA6222488.1 SIMPL domain-containing protein [Streptomyces albofaciens JCM 4342]